MTEPNRLFDEFAKLMTNATGLAQGVKQETDNFMRTQLERMLRDAGYVTREEFEVVRDMAIAARNANDALAARLAALEGKTSA